VGVQTEITLQEVQKLFPNYAFKRLTPTTDGVMDTTYLLDGYILKKYEREMGSKVAEDALRLKGLREKGLNVSCLVAQSKEYYLYERLSGSHPKNITYYHIQAVARFIASMHRVTKNEKKSTPFLAEYSLEKILFFTKKHHFYYYKKLNSLKKFHLKNEGFIHGDIFRDNTLFEGEKVAVFDFIDGGGGEFSFDVAVALLSFNSHNKPAFVELFLQTYNQHAPHKLQKKHLQTQIQKAAKLYALLRIDKYKNGKKAKLLAKFW